jgi:hypothetical protein
MRILFGTVPGAALTIGSAYMRSTADVRGCVVQRPLVNWDGIANKWADLTERARTD